MKTSPPYQTGSYMFYALEPSSRYEVVIQSQNKWGWSLNSEPFYFTTRSTGKELLFFINILIPWIIGQLNVVQPDLFMAIHPIWNIFKIEFSLRLKSSQISSQKWTRRNPKRPKGLPQVSKRKACISAEFFLKRALTSVNSCCAQMCARRVKKIHGQIKNSFTICFHLRRSQSSWCGNGGRLFDFRRQECIAPSPCKIIRDLD